MEKTYKRKEGFSLERKAYSATEVASLLGITRESVYRMVREGRIRVVRIGQGHREFRIPASVLEAYLAGCDSNEQLKGGDKDANRSG